MLGFDPFYLYLNKYYYYYYYYYYNYQVSFSHLKFKEINYKFPKEIFARHSSHLHRPFSDGSMHRRFLSNFKKNSKLNVFFLPFRSGLI